MPSRRNNNVIAEHLMYPLEVILQEGLWQMQHDLLRVAYHHVCYTLCTQSQKQPCCCCCCCCLFTTLFLL